MENMESLFRIARLIAKDREGEITLEEKEEIEEWLAVSKHNEKLYHELKEDKEIYKEILDIGKIDTEKPFKKVWSNISVGESPKKITLKPKQFLKYAAAILLLISMSAITYFGVLRYNSNKQQSAIEIVPGTEKAILITANQQQIELGNNGPKQIFRNENISITDTASFLTYTVNDFAEEKVQEEKVTEEVEYNQLIVPRGGEYSIVLADGSRVKLNADSRLRYPTTFTRDIREVELEGEAYFEVQKAEGKPFVVHTHDMQIKVYGTVFNVSAYNNDAKVYTTLVEGSVGVELTENNSGEEIILKPGQQTRYLKATQEIELLDVDINLYTAWINGLFVFENEPLESILKKLSRWYDCEISFSAEDLRQRSFTGDLKRYGDILSILDMISIASDIEFEIEGKKVIVEKSK